MSHNDFDFEPVRGLPAALPADEKLLWQGSPAWKSLAIRAYHVRKVAIYFAVIVAWRVTNGLRSGHGASDIALSCAFIILLGGVAIAMLSLLAYFNARSTVYSVTSRRVLIRHGIAVPLTMNIPFNSVDSVDMRRYADGTSDISVCVPKDNRIGYLITWPHLRPGRYSRPCPSLRALQDGDRASDVLGAALAAEAGVAPQRAAPRESATPNFGPHTAAA